jgi:hypothetical protein
MCIRCCSPGPLAVRERELPGPPRWPRSKSSRAYKHRREGDAEHASNFRCWVETVSWRAAVDVHHQS